VPRNAPDAKEAENVVNAKGVKITTHLREAPFPPIEAVLFHAQPIVSGEAPILAFGGEGVRRRARLHVGVKQRWLLPDIRAVRMDADGNVALQNQAPGMDII